MERIDRIRQLEYVPSQQDVLHVHTRTSGIVEGRFQLREKRLQIVEAGGCISERRKWEFIFDDVATVIYVVDASAYDATLFEDSRNLRIKDAITTFHWLMSSRINPSAPVILFINKVDVLREKLLRKPFDISNGEDLESADFSVEAGLSPDLAVEHALDSLLKAFTNNAACSSRKIIPFCSSAIASETFSQIVELLDEILEE